jgi:hypothetical protein
LTEEESELDFIETRLNSNRSVNDKPVYTQTKNNKRKPLAIKEEKNPLYYKQIAKSLDNINKVRPSGSLKLNKKEVAKYKVNSDQIRNINKNLRKYIKVNEPEYDDDEQVNVKRPHGAVHYLIDHQSGEIVYYDANGEIIEQQKTSKAARSLVNSNANKDMYSPKIKTKSIMKEIQTKLPLNTFNDPVVGLPPSGLKSSTTK